MADHELIEARLSPLAGLTDQYCIGRIPVAFRACHILPASTGSPAPTMIRSGLAIPPLFFRAGERSRRNRIEGAVSSQECPMKAFAFLILCLGFVALADAATTARRPVAGGENLRGKVRAALSIRLTDATYWVMPVDTTQWQSLTLKGNTPSRRLLYLPDYNLKHPSPNVVDDIIDIDDSPDTGLAPIPSTSAAGYTPAYPRAYTINSTPTPAAPAITSSGPPDRLPMSSIGSMYARSVTA